MDSSPLACVQLSLSLLIYDLDYDWDYELVLRSNLFEASINIVPLGIIVCSYLGKILGYIRGKKQDNVSITVYFGSVLVHFAHNSTMTIQVSKKLRLPWWFQNCMSSSYSFCIAPYNVMF